MRRRRVWADPCALTRGPRAGERQLAHAGRILSDERLSERVGARWAALTGSEDIAMILAASREICGPLPGSGRDSLSSPSTRRRRARRTTGTARETARGTSRRRDSWSSPRRATSTPRLPPVVLPREEDRCFSQDLPLHPQLRVLISEPLQLLALVAREPARALTARDLSSLSQCRNVTSEIPTDFASFRCGWSPSWARRIASRRNSWG